MSLQEMSGGNGNTPPANPTSTTTAPAEHQEPGGDPSQGSQAGEIRLAAWTQQVSKEIRENPELAKELAPFEKLDDLVKAHLDQKKKSAIPGKEAKPEEVDAFWRQLGRPDKPEGYAAAKEKDSGAFLAAAHAARLTDEQASSLWKEVSSNQARLAAARQASQQAELAASLDALRKEQGEKFQQAVEMFDRAVGNTGQANSPLMAQLMEAGLVGNPAVIKAFIALGQAQQESGSPPSGAPPAGGLKSVTEGGWYKY